MTTSSMTRYGINHFISGKIASSRCILNNFCPDWYLENNFQKRQKELEDEYDEEKSQILDIIAPDIAEFIAELVENNKKTLDNPKVKDESKNNVKYEIVYNDSNNPNEKLIDERGRFKIYEEIIPLKVLKQIETKLEDLQNDTNENLKIINDIFAEKNMKLCIIVPINFDFGKDFDTVTNNDIYIEDNETNYDFKIDFALFNNSLMTYVVHAENEEALINDKIEEEQILLKLIQNGFPENGIDDDDDDYSALIVNNETPNISFLLLKMVNNVKFESGKYWNKISYDLNFAIRQSCNQFPIKYSIIDMLHKIYNRHGNFNKFGCSKVMRSIPFSDDTFIDQYPSNLSSEEISKNVLDIFEDLTRIHNISGVSFFDILQPVFEQNKFAFIRRSELKNQVEEYKDNITDYYEDYDNLLDDDPESFTEIDLNQSKTYEGNCIY